MRVTIPCCAADQDQAQRLLLWIAELGKVHAEAILFCSLECDINSLMQAGRLAFTSFRHEVDAENIKCNWQTNDPGSRDPSGPNSIFRQVAWMHYLMPKKDSWLFQEPDSMPLTRDWFQRIEADYKSCGKPIMGDLVSTNSPHLSGVAVYPYNVPELFPRMVHNVQGAFDTSSSKEVLAAAHITPLIMDRWRSPEFTAETFAKIRPEAVLFHADKSGSLIPILRQKLGMKGGDESFAQKTLNTLTSRLRQQELLTTPESVCSPLSLERQNKSASSGAAKSDPSSAPVVDIYLKTYPKDYELANYCLKSIAKFVTGYRRIVLECPTGSGDCTMPFNGLSDELWNNVAVVRSEDRQPGYIDQQAKKLAAFKHTDADYLLYVDSDCCFRRPFDVSEMFKDGKSTWQHTALDNARADQKNTWVPVMERFLGKPPHHEFMRRHPHILPRWLPEEMDKFCRYRHGKTLYEYIRAQGDPDKPLQLSFSEFNCAGFFAWEHFHDRIAWVTDGEATPPPLVQGFTHAGPERIKADIEQFRKILGEGIKDTPKWAPIPDFSAEIEEVSIESCLSSLTAEAAKSPLHKARLWKRITAALGMEKPAQGPKRRRKGAARVAPGYCKRRPGDMAYVGPVPVKRKRGRPKKESSVKDQVSSRPDTNSSRPSVKGDSGSNAPQGGSLISA